MLIWMSRCMFSECLCSLIIVWWWKFFPPLYSDLHLITISNPWVESILIITILRFGSIYLARINVGGKFDLPIFSSEVNNFWVWLTKSLDSLTHSHQGVLTPCSHWEAWKMIIRCHFSLLWNQGMRGQYVSPMDIHKCMSVVLRQGVNTAQFHCSEWVTQWSD